LIDLPDQAPGPFLAQRAYDTDPVRVDLIPCGLKLVVPPKSNRTVIRYSKRLDRQRNCVERVLGRLKINRAMPTRHDRLADSFLGIYSSSRHATNSNLFTWPMSVAGISTIPRSARNTFRQYNFT